MAFRRVQNCRSETQSFKWILQKSKENKCSISGVLCEELIGYLFFHMACIWPFSQSDPETVCSGGKSGSEDHTKDPYSSV